VKAMSPEEDVKLQIEQLKRKPKEAGHATKGA
jgi:hypothetical protein